MGGGNPLKQIVNTVTDVVAKPFREAARAVGADGVVDAVDSIRDKQRGVTGAIIDTTSGKASQMKKDAEAGAAKAQQNADAEAAGEKKRAQEAANAKRESDRMSAGEKSKTLLTGSSGLDDEESISRRTLRGF